MKAEQKNIIRKAAAATGLLTISVITGIWLLCLVYMLPVTPIQDHVKNDLELLQKEGNYTVFWDGVFVRMHPGNINTRTFFFNNRGMARDNYTDALMLGNAVYEDAARGSLEKALNVYHYADESGMPISSLQKYLNEDNSGQTVSYPRYWHGYLVALKPLLCIFTYKQIRILNIVIQNILLILLCRKISRQAGKRYGICLLGGVLLTFPFVVPLCMQYSTAVYVMLISCIIYISHIKYWKKYDRTLYYFMLTGIFTSYVDFLTYPVITLGILLVIDTLLTGEKTGDILKNSFMWCLGYFGMWFGKWVVATIVLKENVIEDGMEQMFFRISSATDTIEEQKISSLTSILANFSSMTNIYYIIVILVLLIFMISIVKKQNGLRIKSVAEQSCYLWIALYPFLWYAVIKNHSYDHSSFTYRALFVTVFALMVMVVRSCEKVDGSDGDHLDKK